MPDKRSQYTPSTLKCMQRVTCVGLGDGGSDGGDDGGIDIDGGDGDGDGMSKTTTDHH